MHSVADCSGSYLVGVVSLFPFDTEWMGREAYLRDPKGDISRVQTYDQGARAATFDFLLNSYSKGIHVIGGNRAIKIVSLVVFARLSLPLSVIYLYSCCKVTSCVPFYVTAELTADTGDDQGLCKIFQKEIPKKSALFFFGFYFWYLVNFFPIYIYILSCKT
ncbi:unnamed protein product [Camellia sinensis]